MKVNLTCIMLVMGESSNEDIRKNTIKNVSLLVKQTNHALPSVVANIDQDIKVQIRNELIKGLGTDRFHLEQVYALGDKKYFDSNAIDIIHLGVTNAVNVNNIASDYDLISVSIEKNTIKIGNKVYSYKTKEKADFSIEYTFETNAKTATEDKFLIELLTAWKHMRTRLEYSDILFKFLPVEFTLEDARQVYMLLSERQVDKSNFHKKIMKYCTEIPGKLSCRGYRPSKHYKFNLKFGDLWQ